jgi:hypothetical protein
MLGFDHTDTDNVGGIFVLAELGQMMMGKHQQKLDGFGIQESTRVDCPFILIYYI